MNRFDIEWLPPDSLIPYKFNSKKHPQSQIDELARLIKRFGFDQPIVIDSENLIIKGEGRYLAAKKLNMKEVPVIRKDKLSDNDKIALRISDNKVAESPWDYDHLKNDFGILKGAGYDIGDTGFDVDEANSVLSGWESDIDAVGNISESDSVARERIIVVCPPEAKKELKEVISQAIVNSGIEASEIEIK